MNQSSNIAQAVKTLWLTNATLPALVPGSIIYGLQKAGATRPFASMTVELEGLPEFQTGNAYVQEYRLTIKVWSSQLVGNAGTIQAALETLLSATTKLAPLTNGAITLHISLEPQGIEEK